MAKPSSPPSPEPLDALKTEGYSPSEVEGVPLRNIEDTNAPPFPGAPNFREQPKPPPSKLNLEQLAALKAGLGEATIKDSAGEAIATDSGLKVASEEGLNKFAAALAEAYVIAQAPELRAPPGTPAALEQDEVVAQLTRSAAAQFLEPSSTGQNEPINAGLSHLVGVGGLSQQYQKTAEAAGAVKPGNTSENLILLEKLQDVKAQTQPVSPGAQTSLVEASKAIHQLLDRMPQPAAASAVFSVLQSAPTLPSSEADRLTHATRLEAAAARLEEAYPGMSAPAQEALNSAADAAKAGDGPQYQASAAASLLAADSLVENLAWTAAAQFRSEFHASTAIYTAISTSGPTADALSEALLQNGELTGDKLVLILQTALQYEKHIDALRTPEGNLRDVLGPAAAGVSNEQLKEAMGADFAAKVQDLGISKEDVQAAVAELQQAAVLSGKDGASIDESVAVQALVLREEVLDKELGTDAQGFEGRPAAQGALASRAQTTGERDEAQASASAEANEMAMAE